MAITITPESLAEGNTEHGHQSAIFSWAALNKDKYPDLKWLFAVPNGAWRNKIVATRLMAEGVKAGVPDIWLPVRRGQWSGLIIELKKLPKKSTHKRPQASDKQGEWIDFLRTQSYGAIVCVGWLEARQNLIEYLEYK